MTRMLVVYSLIAFGGAACMHAGHAATGATPRPSTAAPVQGGMEGMCPTDVPGTRVSAEDTSTGEALTFTTTTDQLPALRERVHAMADMHNRHHAGGDGGHGRMGGMHGGMMGGDPGHGGMKGGDMGDMQMPPPSRADVEDLPDGARIVVTPNDPADLGLLQKTVRMHAEHMQRHGCGMMEHTPG